jgi:hypothetical protein
MKLGDVMYEVHEKIKDPVIVLFMKVDGRIESAMELIMEDKVIPEKDIERLIIYKESLLDIFEGRIGDSREIQYNKVWSANNLINKIDYILDLENNIQ